MGDKGKGNTMSDNKHVVSILNDLLENSRDGEYGFKTCAEQVETASAKTLFATRATGCAQAARELEAMIRQYGGEPASGGTATGALHRGWVKVKGSVGFDSELAILESCEKGEDAALARYRDALKEEGLPADVRALIQRQAEGAQKNHDEVRNLRNIARAQK
jgi:uncharacterized protein (TIGR02284 family)